MPTTGPAYFDSVTEYDTGYTWSNTTNTLAEADNAFTEDLLGDTQTKRLAYFNWANRASVPVDATIDEITFRFRARMTEVAPEYIPKLLPPGSFAQFTKLTTSAVTYSETASSIFLNMTNEERLQAIHSTSATDATDIEFDIIDWGLVFGQIELYWITMEVEWTAASGGGGGGGILLAK